MEKFKLRYKRMGENSLLIEWPQTIKEEILWDILSYKNLIKKNIAQKLIYVNNAYNSLLVRYSSLNDIDSEITDLKSLYEQIESTGNRDSKLWEIPVCYHPSFAIDLQEMAESKGITSEEVINLHVQNTYRVYFIGFLPGFLYLGGLPNILNTPRKAMPRLKVPRGAVAIGGEHTGIYPMESPGGWNIIGNTPVELFQKESTKPCVIQAGDTIRFFSIDLEDYERIKSLVENGEYILNYSTND